MKKMIINSFYNTLIDKEDAIPLSTMLEIERVRKNNYKFTIITNRTCKELMEYNRDFPFIDYIISFNGAVVYDVINKQFLYKKNISNSTIKKIYKLIKNKERKKWIKLIIF